MDNTIRFKSSGENSRRYKFFAEDLNGMYYDCKDRDRPRKEAGGEHLYPYTAPDDVFRLTATESSTDSRNISTGHRASRIRRKEERERVRREMKYSNSDDSMNSGSKEDMQKPFLSKKTHKIVTLSDDEREASMKKDEFKHEDCPNMSSSTSSDSSSEDEAPAATEKETNEKLKQECYNNSLKLNSKDLATKRDDLEEDINALEKKLGQMGTSKKKRIQSWNNQRRLRQQAARLNGVKMAQSSRTQDNRIDA